MNEWPFTLFCSIQFLFVCCCSWIGLFNYNALGKYLIAQTIALCIIIILGYIGRHSLSLPPMIVLHYDQQSPTTTLRFHCKIDWKQFNLLLVAARSHYKTKSTATTRNGRQTIILTCYDCRANDPSSLNYPAGEIYPPIWTFSIAKEGKKKASIAQNR